MYSEVLDTRPQPTQENKLKEGLEKHETLLELPKLPMLRQA